MNKLFLTYLSPFLFAHVVLFADYAPESISQTFLNAQDSNWSVYDEVINFYEDQKFTAKVTNGTDNPIGKGTYQYNRDGNSSASLFYTVEEGNGTIGYTFDYDLIFTSENQGTYTKTANYNGTLDVTNGPFSLLPLLSVRPRSIWASRDLVYLQTPSGPNEIDGAGEIDFWAELTDHPPVTHLNLSVNGSPYDLRQQEAPNGFRTRFEYDSGYGELFDLESASDSDWSPYINETTFTFSMTVDGAQYSYAHNLPAESKLPQPVNVSVNGNYTWKKDTEGYDYVEVLKNDSYQFSWDAFTTIDSKDYIMVQLQELVGDNDVPVMPEVVLDAGETSYTVDGSYFEPGKKYTFYVALINVTEQQNPNGYTHASGSDTSLPLLQTTARMITVVDIMIEDYAPSSLVGKTIHIPEDASNDANYFFTEDEVYYVVPDSNLGLVGISYTFVANTSTTATLTLARNEPGDVIHQISFSSPTNADSNWTDLESNKTGSASLEILTENSLPSSLAGWTYKTSLMNDTLKFIDDSNAVFYDESDSNFSNRELSNITYTWEQTGPRMGKLTTSLGEETLLFFESNTSGFFDWEEIGSDGGNSGQFDLYYYSVGEAFDSLVGSSITIGDTTYVFTSSSKVTVHSPSGKTSHEYAYLREIADEALLSIGSSLYKLDFHNHQYGRIIEGGSGYFSIHQKWATKGWVYYDDLPWIYSNNQGDWMYQFLSENNATNDTELMYFEPWNKQWSKSLDLNFTDQRVFSVDSEYYWEDYDDFNGTELNSSKWDVAWWDGGSAPSIDPNNDQVVFSKGNSLEANLSDLMNTTNSSAESSYSVVDPNDIQPHSLLELKHSPEIHGIEFELMIPNDSSDKTCIGLYAIDYNQMFNANTEADEMRATKFELDLCYFGSIKMEYYYRQPETYEEQKSERAVSLGEYVKAKFEFMDENIIFYFNNQVVAEYPLIKGNEVYVFRAMNEQDLDFSVYLRNVRILRKKTYPQGWMWTDYYPWVYSHETGGWLYFELAKDTDGNPVMNYYDHKTGSWDLYGPSLIQFYER